jgi:hypothetical protein
MIAALLQASTRESGCFHGADPSVEYPPRYDVGFPTLRVLVDLGMATATQLGRNCHGRPEYDLHTARISTAGRLVAGLLRDQAAAHGRAVGGTLVPITQLQMQSILDLAAQIKKAR